MTLIITRINFYKEHNKEIYSHVKHITIVQKDLMGEAFLITYMDDKFKTDYIFIEPGDEIRFELDK